MQLCKRISDVTITRYLRMGKNATMKVTNADNTESTIDLTELTFLDGLTASTDELNILDGVTATTAELNILDGVTSTAAELNILDGVTSTAAELNILDGVTSTAAELNILDGVTADATELNLIDGVTATTAEINTACDQSVQVLAAGAGITDGSTTVHTTGVEKVGDLFKTTIYLDITDLQSSTTDLDIIGTGASASYIGQITAALNGTVFFGQITCLESPATGVTDIDFYSATENTGVFDAGVATLTETALLTKGSAWTGAVATPIIMTALPAADEYLYLTGGAAGTVGTYTSGQFMIELWGA